MNSTVLLQKLRDESFVGWQQGACTDVRRLFVFACGYESRGRYFADKVLRTICRANAEFVAYGFTEFAEIESRKRNEEFCKLNDIPLKNCSSEDGKAFLNSVSGLVSEMSEKYDGSIEVHVDYSCMPRNWYCRLPLHLGSNLQQRHRVFMWYTPGIYPDPSFPTAGIDDFTVSSGRPSLSPRVRTHILGLGFDKVRSAAIHSVLDPEHLICFYADPAVNQQYAERVRSDNDGILASANLVLTVPLTEFVTAYSMLASLVREYRCKGDVILVPDGPKPLILAASLMPQTHNGEGVICFHVTRGKAPNMVPIDVNAAGDAVGMSFVGSLG